MKTTITVEVDDRGESETYEAYNLVCRDNETGHIVWIEGIQKERSTMYPEYRAIVEPALLALKAGV